MRNQRPQQEIEIDIDAIGFEGVAVGRLDGLVHFVAGALPGERVRARITGTKKRFKQAEVVEVLHASPDRRTPPCPQFGVCGGCKWQHLSYEEQARWKRQHVVDAFERLAQVPIGVVHPTMSSPEIYGYRNKMEFSFGGSAWLTREEIDSGVSYDTAFALGLHVPGRFDKVRNITTCMLQHDVANRVLEHTHLCSERAGIQAYHQRHHDGFARHLVIRNSVATGAVMTVLITTTPKEQHEEDIVQSWFELAPTLPSGSSMIHAINDTWSPVAVGQIARIVGPGYLDEVSLDVSYRISPFSFFQTNTLHLPNLITRALDGAMIQSTDIVWDLYCGTGTLTLPAARRAKHVVGAELSESSIADAQANAERNAIENVAFHAVDLHVPAALDVLRSFPQPDVILIDPPRNGMHEQVVRHILAVAPERLIYVSCNPATMARDCAILAELYDVVEVTPVDMFPQTYHVEAVGVLRKRTC